MKNQAEKSGIIVAFQIGRGGRFNNGGHKSFIGEKKIGDFTNDLFINYENAQNVFSALEGRENLCKIEPNVYFPVLITKSTSRHLSKVGENIPYDVLNLKNITKVTAIVCVPKHNSSVIIKDLIKHEESIATSHREIQNVFISIIVGCIITIVVFSSLFID